MAVLPSSIWNLGASSLAAHGSRASSSPVHHDCVSAAPAARRTARGSAETDVARGPRVIRRRTLLETFVCSGLLYCETEERDGAKASEGDGGGELPLGVGPVNGKIRSCEGAAPCVSTSAFRSPSRFMPPWQYLGSRAAAYSALLKALERMGATIMKIDGERYVYATLSASTSKDDIDDLEFLFVGNVVCFRSLSRRTALDPPFCWWPGCINGPSNRGRMEALRDNLGWIPLETDEEKEWNPIFLH